MRTVVHDRHEQNPPHASHTSGSWATASRRHIEVVALPVHDGFEPSDPYVRRFWVAAIGAGPVEDLLRLVRAARNGVPVRSPLFLGTLLTEGLVAFHAGRVVVPDPIPMLGRRALSRLSPGLRRQHAQLVLQRRAERPAATPPVGP